MKISLVFLASLLSLMTFATDSNIATNSCDLVEVVSLLFSDSDIQKKSGAIGGVGWVIAEKNQKFILVPSHVINVGDVNFIKCRDDSWKEAQIVGKSDTLDLALLKVVNDEGLVAMFSMQELHDNIFELKGANLVRTIDPKAKEYYQETIRFVIESLEYPKHNFPQYHKILMTEMFAIKPGMSGSPIYKGKNEQNFPAGMLIKTKNNDSRTVSISLEDIRKHLPLLLKGKNPWRENRPDTPYVKTVRRFDKKKGRFFVKRRLEFPLEELVLSERCSDSDYTVSSEMGKIPPLKKVLSLKKYTLFKNSSIAPAMEREVSLILDAIRNNQEGERVNISSGSGGDWGDGGDPVFQHAHRSATGIYSGLTPEDPWENYIQTSMFKKTKYCRYEGLANNNQKALIGIWTPKDNVSRKVVSIEDVLDLAIGKIGKFSNYVKSNGIFAKENKTDVSKFFRNDIPFNPYAIFCRKEILGENLAARDSGGSSVKRHIMLDGKREYYVSNKSVGRIGKVKDDNFEGVFCQDNTIQLKNFHGGEMVDLDDPKFEYFFHYDLNISKSAMKGIIRVNTCTIEIDVKKRIYWDIFLDTKNLKVEIKLNPNPDRGPLFEVNVIEIDPICTMPEEYQADTEMYGIKYGALVPWFIRAYFIL